MHAGAAGRGVATLGVVVLALVGMASPTTEVTTGSTLPPRQHPRSILLTGDSVMGEIAVAARAATEGIAEVDFVLAPGLVTAKPDFWPAWTGIFAQSQPDAIGVLIGPWEITESTFGTPEWWERYRGTLDRWAEILRSSGAPITWLSALPTRDPAYTARLDLVNSEYATLARRQPGITMFDSASPLGSNHYLEHTPDGARLRRVDGLHLCPEGTERVTNALLRAMGVPTVAGWEQGTWRTDPAVHRAEQCP
jgi:hypothetical protein